jgi:hypothetical protein
MCECNSAIKPDCPIKNWTFAGQDGCALLNKNSFTNTLKFSKVKFGR